MSNPRLILEKLSYVREHGREHSGVVNLYAISRYKSIHVPQGEGEGDTKIVHALPTRSSSVEAYAS